MLNKKQLMVIGSVVILMGILLSFDIKGLIKPKDPQNASGTASSSEVSAAHELTAEGVSVLAKQDLSADMAKQISDLESSLSTATSAQKLAIQKQLAQKWDDINKPAPAAFYHEMIAGQEKSYDSWIKTGDEFTSAYQNTQDTLMQPALTQKAIDAYQKALAMQPNSLAAKTGLGVAYVSGTGEPMTGIQLLLGVVKEDPENVPANMNLGIFSMKSGQFDKAVGRFKTVVAKSPNQAEAWFYLASSYENIGLKSDAIAAYVKSKELAADPGLSSFVDKKILELKK